jgi:hypothetical protein
MNGFGHEFSARLPSKAHFSEAIREQLGGRRRRHNSALKDRDPLIAVVVDLSDVLLDREWRFRLSVDRHI